jgi:hypothetical protein
MSQQIEQLWDKYFAGRELTEEEWRELGRAQPVPGDWPGTIKVQAPYAESVRAIWDRYEAGEELGDEDFKLLALAIANKADALAILLRLWAYPPDPDIPHGNSLCFENV